MPPLTGQQDEAEAGDHGSTLKRWAISEFFVVTFLGGIYLNGLLDGKGGT